MWRVRQYQHKVPALSRPELAPVAFAVTILSQLSLANGNTSVLAGPLH
jgi:hypothetical protein